MPTPALKTEDEIRAAAQLLSKAADAYNTRLKREAGRLTSGEVFARLQEEQRLRGIANQLYFEASTRTLDATVDDQTAMEATLVSASAALVSVDNFERVMALVADLLVLGGSIISGRPATILAALAEVRKDVAAADKKA